MFPAVAEGITPDAVNNAEFGKTRARAGKADTTIVKVQILLDRALFARKNRRQARREFRKALIAFAQANGLPPSEELTPEIWAQLSASGSEPVITTYRITKRDVEGPFLKKLPAKMDDMKGLKALSYSSARELLAERFHMSEDLLRNLNGEKQIYDEGMEIRVANVKRTGERPLGARIEVDKSRQLVTVFGKDSEVIAVYPATVGSDEKPSPSGTLKVTAVRKNPSYRYNPAFECRSAANR